MTDMISWVVTDETPTTVAAVYVSADKVKCAIPIPDSGFSITLSNDGNTFATQHFLFLAYDTRCYECDFGDYTSGTCSSKVKTGIC